MGDFQRELYEKHLYDAHHAASRDCDQAILTLPAVTLVLSVTFAHNITPEPAARSRDFPRQGLDRTRRVARRDPRVVPNEPAGPALADRNGRPRPRWSDLDVVLTHQPAGA